LALLFDIRDEHTDKNNNLHTIATFLGAARTRIFCSVLLLLELGLIYSYDYKANDVLLYLVLSLFTLLVAMVVWGAKYNQNIFYYFFLVDGMMMFQYLLIYTVL
jgi:4-hydroxybenzoate polyprenyltransferase